MKILKLFGIILLSQMLINACNMPEEEIRSNEANSINNLEFRSGKKEHQSDKKEHQLELPFKAHFYTKRDYSNDGVGYCSEDPFLAFNYQVGEGHGTHLGHFTTIMKFCGSGFDYKNGEGVFVAANGDELYFNIPSEEEVGHVIPFEDSFYEAYFRDPFEFTGGTGRFEGASGHGMTNSFVDLFDDEGNFIPEHKTDHEWTGKLILHENCK